MQSQEEINAESYCRPGLVREYHDEHALRPVESLLLLRYRNELRGRVVELGCGTGRVTRHLLELTTDLLAIDISPAMIAVCRERFDEGAFVVGDIRDFSELVSPPLDAVVAPYNVIDVLGNANRRRLLADIGAALRPGGLLILSTHNLAATSRITGPRVFDRRPRKLAANLARLPSRALNRRRLLPDETSGDGFAIRNDMANGFGLLHYYVSPERQREQLEQAGLEPLACLRRDGELVPPGSAAPEADELHYTARRPA